MISLVKEQLPELIEKDFLLDHPLRLKAKSPKGYSDFEKIWASQPDSADWSQLKEISQCMAQNEFVSIFKKQQERPHFNLSTEDSLSAYKEKVGVTVANGQALCFSQELSKDDKGLCLAFVAAILCGYRGPIFLAQDGADFKQEASMSILEAYKTTPHS